MEMPDFSEIAKAQVAEERYEVREKKPDVYDIIIMGSGSGGAVCKFPKREGRDHLQKARAELFARAAGMAAIIAELEAILAGAQLTINDQDEQISELKRERSVLQKIAAKRADMLGSAGLYAD